MIQGTVGGKRLRHCLNWFKSGNFLAAACFRQSIHPLVVAILACPVATRRRNLQPKLTSSPSVKRT
jgi:hypothetical protein